MSTRVQLETPTLGVGSAQDQRPQLGLPAHGQARGADTRPVAQAVSTLGVVAHDRIAQSPTLHAGKTRRLGARHAIQRIGDGEGA